VKKPREILATLDARRPHEGLFCRLGGRCPNPPGKEPAETGRARRSEDYGNCRFPVETVGCHGRKHLLGSSVQHCVISLTRTEVSLLAITVLRRRRSTSAHAKAAPSPCSPVQTSSSAMRARSVSVPSSSEGSTLEQIWRVAQLPPRLGHSGSLNIVVLSVASVIRFVEPTTLVTGVCLHGRTNDDQRRGLGADGLHGERLVGLCQRGHARPGATFRQRSREALRQKARRGALVLGALSDAVMGPAST